MKKIGMIFLGLLFLGLGGLATLVFFFQLGETPYRYFKE